MILLYVVFIVLYKYVAMVRFRFGKLVKVAMSLSLQKPTMFAPRLKSILLHKIIATLENYLCTVSLLANVNESACLEDILPVL